MGTSNHFIAGEDYEREDVADINSALDEGKDKNVAKRAVPAYRLGEEIANGVKFFGQVQVNKVGQRTAMCICPTCKELWRVAINNVKRGNSKSCGCSL